MFWSKNKKFCCCCFLTKWCLFPRMIPNGKTLQWSVGRRLYKIKSERWRFRRDKGSYPKNGAGLRRFFERNIQIPFFYLSQLIRMQLSTWKKYSNTNQIFLLSFWHFKFSWNLMFLFLFSNLEPNIISLLIDVKSSITQLLIQSAKVIHYLLSLTQIYYWTTVNLNIKQFFS
jgi:hypothetical protein